jgi:hypothetical protein
MMEPPVATPDQSIPIIILGGRDRRGSRLPEAGEGKHPLRGYKAVDLTIGGRPLISILVERLRACGAFDPIYVAGPALLYESLDLPIRVVDTDGDFAQNIRASLERVTDDFPASHVAFTTCDILPEPTDLERLMRDYRAHLPLDFWVPQIRVPGEPSQLGESAWKPRYEFVPEGESEPVATLPGHMLIVDPAAMRTALVYRMFELAYRTRNRPVELRKKVMMRSLLKYLLGQDLKRLMTLRAPVLTWEVISGGKVVALGLREGDQPSQTIADMARKMLIRRRHRKAHPESKGRMPVLDGLSMAKDIDTEEEAREAERRLGGDESPSDGSARPGRP